MSVASSPLAGVNVVNQGAGLAPALISKFLGELGARVVRLAPLQSDPFISIYPAYEALRGHEQNELQSLASAAAAVDVCILGGEDHPELAPRTAAETLLAANPRLIVLDIQGYPEGVGGMGRHAVDILVQARSGICYEHYSDRPNFVTYQPTQYGAAMQGLIGIVTALYEREFSDRGQGVSTSLYEGALCWLTTWSRAENATPMFKFSMPLDPRPILLQCKDGLYVHVCLGSAGAKATLYRILGIDAPGMDPNDAGLPNPADPPHKFFGDIELLASYAANWHSAELLDAFTKAGLPGEIALPPGACWDHPQVQHNGLIRSNDAGVRHVGNPLTIRAVSSDDKPQPPVDQRPLSGLTVLDFGAFVAGPVSSVMLSDLGAEVIKVEPLNGDPMRSVVRPFNSASRGKKSLAVDMKSAEGAEIVRRLCDAADIVTNNFRPGVSAKLGIDAATLHARKPSLIVLEAPGYGASGPTAQKGAFDPILQALCGHEYRAGGEGNAPLWSRTAMVDYSGGYLGAIATLAALYNRARTGDGAEIVSPLLNAGIFLLSELIHSAEAGFAGAALANAEQTGFRPAESMYRTGDGWIAVAVRSQDAANALAGVLDLGAELAAPYRTWAEKEAAALRAACAQRNSNELLATLEEAGVWAEACRQGMDADIFDNQALFERGTLFSAPYAKFGATAAIGPLLSLGRSRVKAQRGAPEVGEHSREILEVLGYSAADIDGLFAQRVVA